MLRNARRCGDATNGNVVKLGALAGRASAKAQSYAPAAWPRMVGQPASSSPWHPVANTGDRPSGILSTTVKFRLSLVQGASGSKCATNNTRVSARHWAQSHALCCQRLILQNSVFHVS